jgi:transglutaminase-like putative cysteine protease
LPFGGLEPNAITVLRAQIRHKPSEIGLPWSKIYTPRVFVPREEFEVALVWDQDATVPVWRTDFDGLKCERTGERAARCRASAIQPYPIDPDIDYWDELPSLIVAEPARWEVIASDMNATVTSSLSDGSAAEEKLAELIADASSDREKLDRIHRFVSGDIRYLGLEHGVGGIVPRPAATTLIRKFGDCKDKTTLFIDLARRAGIDAYPVLTSTSRYRASKLLLPAVTYFNHMVSCAVLLNQEEYCVDLTDPYTPYNELPGGLQGAIRLDSRTTPDGPGHFPVMSHRWQKDVNTVNILFADGSMEERQTRVYRGPYATFLRAILRGKTVEERHQWAVNDFQENISKGSKPETDFDGIEDSSESLVVRSTIRYPNFFAVSGGKMEDIESWLAYMGRIFQSANEHHPYDFPGLRYRSTLEYQLAPGVTVQTTGPRLLFESRWGKLRREYKVEVSKVYVETELEMRQQKIPAAELENFNEFLGLAQNYSRVWFSPLTQGDD